MAHQFNSKLLRILSADSEDWEELMNSIHYRNMENSVYGALVYPRKGISKERLDSEVIDWIGTQHNFATGGLDTKVIEHNLDEYGSCWIVVYHITAWYNHFDLDETF